MKFTIGGTSLLKALSYLAGSVSSTDNRPTYRKFALTRDEDNIVFSTPVGDYNAVVELPVKFEQVDEETAILPFEELLDFTKQFQDDDFTFTVQKGQCDISLKNSSHAASLQSTGDTRLFGKAPLSGKANVKLPAEVKDALRFVFPARSKDSARPDICGVDIDSKRIVASDGHICLHQSIKIEDLQNVALTQESFCELLRLLGVDETAECAVKVKDFNAMFQIGPCRFFTKLRPKSSIANLDKVITGLLATNKEEWAVSKKDLLRALPVARLATFPEDRRARFKLYKNKVVIQSQTREGSVGTAELKSTWTGESGFEVVLNLDRLETLIKDFGDTKEKPSTKDKKAKTEVTDTLVFCLASKHKPEDKPEGKPIAIQEGNHFGIIQPSLIKLASKEKVTAPQADKVEA